MLRFLKNIIFDATVQKFVIVGMLNTAFSFFVYAVLIFAGIHYTFAVLLATVIGILFNYQTTRKVVFTNRASRGIFYFSFVYFVVYCQNIFGIWCLEIFGLENKYISGAIMIAPSAALSFYLNKRFVFAPTA